MTRLAYALPLAMIMAACRPTVPPPEPGTATRTETAEAPPAQARAATPASDASPVVTMRYRCNQGHRVDIFSGDVARVTLADGRVVDIERVDGSAPPRYAGVALSFEVGSEGAMLGQDETGGFACDEAD
jgi:hypothetical protein